jgi:hypothetical protein
MQPFGCVGGVYTPYSVTKVAVFKRLREGSWHQGPLHQELTPQSRLRKGLAGVLIRESLESFTLR